MISMQKKKRVDRQTLPMTAVSTEVYQPDVFLDNLNRVVNNFGFQQVLLPAMEERKIFARSPELTRLYGEKLLDVSGGSSDLVFPPTHLFSVMRRYLQNFRLRGPHVSKWFHLSPVIRPASGKLATEHELGLYILGEDSSVAGAQLVNITAEILRELGIPEFVIELNSLGCKLCQGHYQGLLTSYLASAAGRLCETCEYDLEKNPTALWRCNNGPCQEIVAGASQIVDCLDEHCKANLMGVLENIDDLGIPYTLNPILAPELLSEKIVFRITSSQTGSEAIGQGGNYSSWSGLLGSAESLPIMGFVTTFEKLCQSVPEERRRIGPKVEVFMIPLGLIAMRKAMVLHRDLQHSGVATAEAMLGNSSIKNQLKEAVGKKCEIALIIGQKEAIEETVILRDMRSGMQEVFALDRIIEEVKKRLGK